ncbi:hypothetical protein ZEAMMB73_Zm00001d006859 [Zea mays]|uniref:protein-serine/threonine phosphatase n=1 Tax=Zea mays TaxID=4577 RepID=A0A1D6F1C7_MAIZE|nr:hypothetical protein ZEAMMB73_Zm00001d006859 [Zea mays]ONM25267.1 hypothetical protein ZEAMMB73_Zm00001d006859 [Zea mays]
MEPTGHTRSGAPSLAPCSAPMASMSMCHVMERMRHNWLGETYQKTDIDFLESEASAFRDDGSTASTAILVGDRLYVANVGDSCAVIPKAGKAMALSEDHKPNRIDEQKRIENACGIVIWAGKHVLFVLLYIGLICLH